MNVIGCTILTVAICDSNDSWCSFLVRNIFRGMPQVYLFFLIICSIPRLTVHVLYTVAMADEVMLESAVRGFHVATSCAVLLCVQFGPGM